ncbi:radical SAM protein [bacterium]|nr:radical SAM protein [bacterium]
MKFKDLITEIDNRLFFFFNQFKKEEKKVYTSCPWIESGVCFDNGVYGSNIKLCCYMSAPGGGNSMIFTDYWGEKINWRKFFKIKNDYRAIQKNGGTIKECEGCIFFETREWNNKDYIDSIIVDHFTRCNCNCIYCYTEEDKQGYNNLKTYNLLPVIKDMFKYNILKPGGAIGFGGGEPTILEEFEELTELLLKNKFTNIRINSSGIKFSPIIAKGIASRQITVVVSMDSATRETYKKIKQIDAFDKVCENLIKYSQAQTQTGFVVNKYIIIPEINDTKEEIMKWVDFNKENKIESLVIDVENSRFERFREEKNSSVLELCEFAQNYAKEKGIIRFEAADRLRHLIKSLKGNN